MLHVWFFWVRLITGLVLNTGFQTTWWPYCLHVILVRSLRSLYLRKNFLPCSFDVIYCVIGSRTPRIAERSAVGITERYQDFEPCFFTCFYVQMLHRWTPSRSELQKVLPFIKYVLFPCNARGLCVETFDSYSYHRSIRRWWKSGIKKYSRSMNSIGYCCWLLQRHLSV